MQTTYGRRRLVCVCVCIFADYINSGGIKTKSWLMNHKNMFHCLYVYVSKFYISTDYICLCGRQEGQLRVHHYLTYLLTVSGGSIHISNHTTPSLHLPSLLSAASLLMDSSMPKLSFLHSLPQSTLHFINKS